MDDDLVQYSIADYGLMLMDARRVAAFEEALSRSVVQGSVVVDIGTGTGAMALLAARLGARRVHAIEPNPAISAARELAKHHAWAERICFHQALSTDVRLAEPADVIVSDIRGVTPFFQTHIPSIVDARDRLLRPGGTMIPTRDRVEVALLSCAATYEETVGPWEREVFGLDMTPLRAYGIRNVERARAPADAQVTTVATWCTLDYTNVTSANMHGVLSVEASRDATAHGIAAWFDTELIEGVGYSNAPGSAKGLYGQQFFPLERPLELDAGDRVEIELEARLLEGQYVWRWNTKAIRPGRDTVAYRQSNLFDTPIDAKAMRRRAESYAGPLSTDGRLARDVLQALDDGEAIASIAGRVQESHAERFPSSASAHAFVADLAARYGA